MDQRLYQLNHQTILKDRYEVRDYTVRTPLYTQRINAFHTPYVITNQFDKNNNLSLFQANTQNLAYDNIVCQKPPQEGKSRFNYAIDNHITNKLVDVSGSVFKNSELRVNPYLNTTPAKNQAVISSLENDFRKYYSNSITNTPKISYSTKRSNGRDVFDAEKMYLLPRNKENVVIKNKGRTTRNPN